MSESETSGKYDDVVNNSCRFYVKIKWSNDVNVEW